jgi:hypothetical protein
VVKDSTKIMDMIRGYGHMIMAAQFILIGYVTQWIWMQVILVMFAITFTVMGAYYLLKG